MTLSNLRSTVIGGWETEFNTWNANKVPAEGFNEVFDAIQHMNREANGGDTARTNPTDAERLRTTIAAATRALIAALGSSPI